MKFIALKEVGYVRACRQFCLMTTPDSSTPFEFREYHHTKFVAHSDCVGVCLGESEVTLIRLANSTWSYSYNDTLMTDTAIICLQQVIKSGIQII